MEMTSREYASRFFARCDLNISPRDFMALESLFEQCRREAEIQAQREHAEITRRLRLEHEAAQLYIPEEV